MITRSPDQASLTPAMARERHPAVARGRLYAALRSGALPSVRVGRRTAIAIQDLDDWVAQGGPVEVRAPVATGQIAGASNGRSLGDTT